MLPLLLLVVVAAAVAHAGYRHYRFSGYRHYRFSGLFGLSGFCRQGSQHL
jgi:hypothetical protein